MGSTTGVARDRAPVDRRRCDILSNRAPTGVVLPARPSDELRDYGVLWPLALPDTDADNVFAFFTPARRAGIPVADEPARHERHSS